MQFNDTTTYDGLVQHYEKWTRQPRGTVSGSTNLLKEFASSVNSYAFPKLIPYLLAFNDQIRWDDLNHTDKPVGTVNMVASQNDYKITVDDNSLDILNITGVAVLNNSGDTLYHDLERMTADDPDAQFVTSPDTSITGTPLKFLELGNTIYLYPIPASSITNGIKLFFGRQQSYFANTDTTKEPGIPLPFHILLALLPALEWNMVNRTDDTNLLTLLRNEIEQRIQDCKDFIALRHPTKPVMRGRKINYL